MTERDRDKGAEGAVGGEGLWRKGERGAVCVRQRERERFEGLGACVGSAIKSAHTGKNLGAFKAE